MIREVVSSPSAAPVTAADDPVATANAAEGAPKSADRSGLPAQSPEAKAKTDGEQTKTAQDGNQALGLAALQSTDALVAPTVIGGTGPSAPAATSTAAKDLPRTDGLAAAAQKLDDVLRTVTPDSKKRTPMAADVAMLPQFLASAPGVPFPPDFAGRVVSVTHLVDSGALKVDPRVADLLHQLSQAVLLQNDLRNAIRQDTQLQEKQIEKLQNLIRLLNELFRPDGKLDQQMQARARETVAMRSKRAGGLLESSNAASATNGGTASDGTNSGATAEGTDVLQLLQSTPSADVQVPAPALVQLEKAYRVVAVDFSGMDVVELAQIVMLQCATENEQDVKDMLADMQKAAADKKALRDKIESAKQAQSAIDKQIRDEYNARTNLNPQNTLYVDSSKVSFDDYEKSREVAMNQNAFQNDPTCVTPTLMLTNNLVVYARPGEDAGPGPSPDALDSKTADLKKDATDAYASQLADYNKQITAYTAAWGTSGDDETKSVIGVAAQLGISNDSAGQMYRLYKQALTVNPQFASSFGDFVHGDAIFKAPPGSESGDMPSGKLGLAAGADLATIQSALTGCAQAIESSANMNLDRDNYVGLDWYDCHIMGRSAPGPQEKEIRDLVDKRSALMALDNLSGPDLPGKGNIAGQIAAINAKIGQDATDWQLSNVQKQYIDTVITDEVGKFKGRLDAALGADRDALKNSINQDRHSHAEDVVKGMNGTENFDYHGSESDTIKNQQWINDQGNQEKRDCNTLNVTLGSQSHVGKLLASARDAIGMDNATFDRQALNGALHDGLTLLVGTVAAGDIFFNARWFHVRTFEEAGQLQTGTFIAANLQYQPSYDALSSKLQNISDGKIFNLTGDQTRKPLTVTPPTMSARGDSELSGVPPPDPTTTGITFDPNLDALIQKIAAGGQSYKDAVAALGDQLYQRYPSKKEYFDQYVGWLCGKITAKLPTVDTGALQRDLDAVWTEKDRVRQEIVDKDNDRLFKNHAEPPAGLQRLTLAVWQTVIDGLQNGMDTLGNLTEQLQTRLQLALDRRSKMYETLSNIIKKASDTGGNIVQNMK